MPLRKPSEFFNDKKPKSSLDLVKEELDSAAPEKIERISEVFDAFKTNVNHLQKLSDFTNSFDTFSSNVDKINSLYEGVENLKIEIQNFIKKEDLDDVLMAQIFFIEQSIRDVQERIKSINSETLSEIKEEISDIAEVVNTFTDIEIPTYKKSIVESETRIDTRFLVHKESIDSKIKEIDDEISNRFLSIVETLRGINENDLSSLKEDINSIDKKVSFVLEEDLPKYKKVFAESEIKVEQKISNAEKKIEGIVSEVDEKYKKNISLLKEELNEFINKEIPKYTSILTETKFKNESEIKLLAEKVENKLSSSLLSIEEIQTSINNKSQENDKILDEKLLEIKNFIENSKSEIEAVSITYKNLYEDFRRREIHENKKLEDYSLNLEEFSSKLNNLENTLTEDICELQGNLDISTSKYFDILKKEVGFFEQNISEKLKTLEVNFIRNESHIQNAAKDLHEAISKLKIDELENKNLELTKKISHLESILEKFDENKILSEDASLTLAEPPNVKNKDPLTPLDQNYVTLQDLQNHYRLFINRVQQQLATVGGGGAGFIKDLDDVTFDESTGTNKLLIYNGTNWVGIASTSLQGSTSLVDLTDVDTANLGDGRFLRYNASTSEFTFEPVSASNLELIAGDIQSGILTTSSLGAAVVMSISASTYRSANYQIQVTEGTNYNMTTINVIHDGTNTYMTEYGTINQPIGIATFSTDISGGSLRLLGYPAFTSDTTFKVIFTAIEV